MNEEEFIETETKRIWRIYVGLGLLLLVATPTIALVVSSNVQLGLLFPVIFASVPSLFLLFLPRKKEVQGFWYSRERLSPIHLKGLSIFLLFIAAGFVLAGIAVSRSDLTGNTLSVFSFTTILSFLLFSVLAVKYIERDMKRTLEKFEMSRAIPLNIPVNSAKELVISALKNLNLQYSEAIPRSKFDVPWHVEFESGMRIYAASHFKKSEIVIVRIPKGDTTEPEIEKEILRLIKPENAGKT